MGGTEKLRVVVASTLLALPFGVPQSALADACRNQRERDEVFRS